MPRRYVQTSASSKKQLKEAEKVEAEATAQDLEDIQMLLNSPAFRRFMWRILEYTKMFETIWDPSARIHYNSGRQDVGHWLWSVLEKARPEAMIQLIVERRKEQEDDSTSQA